MMNTMFKQGKKGKPSITTILYGELCCKRIKGVVKDPPNTQIPHNQRPLGSSVENKNGDSVN